MTQTIKVKPEQVNGFIERLRRDVNIDIESPKTPYEKLRGKIRGETIVVYNTGKVIVPSNTLVLATLRNILRELSPEEFDVVIGSDEAGKGEWLGPLTVAAVAVHRDSIPDLQVQGVMDSKELSLERIRNLVKPITAAALGSKVLVFSPSRFNELLIEYREEGRNLNDLLAWGHRKAIEALLTSTVRLQTIKVVIDEFDELKTSRELHKLKDFPRLRIIQKPKAEELTPVAAASILARAAREEWLDRQSQRLKVDLRKVSKDDVRTFPNAKEIAKMEYIRNKA